MKMSIRLNMIQTVENNSPFSGHLSRTSWVSQYQTESFARSVRIFVGDIHCLINFLHLLQSA